jgi:two-component system cell cycle sensor histidine kinase/response regulator CckA
MDCNLKEDDIKDEADRYRVISGLTSDFFYCLAVRPDSPMKLVWVDGAHQKLTGYTAEEICNSDDWATIIHPEDLSLVKKTTQSILSNQQCTFEYRIKAKTGEQHWFQDHAQPVWSDKEKRVTSIIGAIKDITEQKQAEASLQASEKRYRRFFLEDLSGAYISKPDGRLVACNPAFARIFGFSSVQEALETRMESSYPETSTRVEYLKRLYKSKKLVNFKSIMRHRDGSSLNIVENTIGIFDAQEKLVEIKGFLVDVTRQTKLEAQLQKARKMETVGTLAGGIAHEFNNLLMTIQGNTSLIQYDLDTADPHFQMLVKIEEAVGRGVKLTQQLLGYAKKGKYEVKSLNLNRLVLNITNTFGRSKNDIAVHYELSEDIPAILADQDQIEQVLLNLLANAADAMADRGKLFLKTSNVTHDHIQARLYVPIPGDYIKLAVTDSGSGMDELTRDRIFDPFFTTKGMGNGKGLGLASVYGIIKSHGGYIEVESEKGRGSTFNIFLPASRKKIPEVQVSSAEDAAKGGVILMAEDEDLVLEVGVRYLNKLGYTALIARNGYEAVEVYQEKRDAISLVIMDMIMPHMGGGQAYDKIKKVNPDVKVLLSSGYSIDGQAQEILDRGCDGFLQKPFSMEQLADIINEILTNLDEPENELK